MKKTQTHCSECKSRDKGIFCELKDTHINALEQGKSFHSYKMHQVVFHQGGHPFGLYCLSTGKVKLYETDNEGNQQVVRVAQAGDVIGYRSLLANQPYPVTAETIEEADICFIHRDTFLHIIKEHAPTNFNVMQLLAEELGTARHQLTRMAHKNVRERLAELLLSFKEKYGVQESRGYRLDIQLSRQAMAEFIGTSQESVIRLLGEFKQDGYIIDEDKHIIITDLKNLIKTAHLVD